MNILQIPAFLRRQTDSLVAAAKTKAKVDKKRAVFGSRCYESPCRKSIKHKRSK